MRIWVDTWGIQTQAPRSRREYIALHNPISFHGTMRRRCRLNGDMRERPIDTLPHLERGDDGFIRAYFPDEDPR
jgi:hypothetical protein